MIRALLIILLIALICSACATLPVESVTPEPEVGSGAGPAFLVILGVIALIVTGVLASG